MPTNTISPHLQALVTYISESNPKGVVKLANKNGVIPPVNSQQRHEYLYHYISENGDKAFEDLSLLHPDRDLILMTKDKPGFSFEGHTPTYEPDNMRISYKPLSFIGDIPQTPANPVPAKGIVISVTLEHVIIIVLAIAVALMWYHKNK